LLPYISSSSPKLAWRNFIDPVELRKIASLHRSFTPMTEREIPQATSASFTDEVLAQSKNRRAVSFS
jgi:hypothetical protein